MAPLCEVRPHDGKGELRAPGRYDRPGKDCVAAIVLGATVNVVGNDAPPFGSGLMTKTASCAGVVQDRIAGIVARTWVVERKVVGSCTPP